MDETVWMTTHGDRVTVYRSGLLRRHFSWRVQAAGNNEIVGSGEQHTTKQAAVVAAERHHPPVVS